MTQRVPEYVARRIERRRGAECKAISVPWGHLYRVTWLDSGFNTRTGDYHADVPRTEWIAFDPEGHLVRTSSLKREATLCLEEEREEPGLHASSWTTTWREEVAS